jgi:hypothetical protein
MTRLAQTVILPTLLPCLAPARPALAQPSAHMDALLRTFDTDGDGVLSTSEIENAAARLRGLDADMEYGGVGVTLKKR